MESEFTNEPENLFHGIEWPKLRTRYHSKLTKMDLILYLKGILLVNFKKFREKNFEKLMKYRPHETNHYTV